MSNRDFKGWLVTHGIKQKEVARLLGITDSMLSQKFNGRSEFTLKQIRTICDHYKVSAEIFLK